MLDHTVNPKSETSKMNYQTGIIQPVPNDAAYLFLDPVEGADILSSLNKLALYVDGESVVVGLGITLTERFAYIPHLTGFPDFSHSDLSLPATDDALLCWIRGEDPGEVFHTTRKILDLLRDAFILRDDVIAFCHKGGHDLTGYEDGTENPQGDEAEKAAFMQHPDKSLNGSSFLTIQQWQHDFCTFDNLSEQATDDVIGRRLSDNDEFDEAPISAHVKRTAQESFSPEAFMLRRSMPWVDGCDSGLMFAAFAHSFYAFESQMKRMIGIEDDVVDGLFTFSQPLTGSYFWCPPMNNDGLDLSALLSQ